VSTTRTVCRPYARLGCLSMADGRRADPPIHHDGCHGRVAFSATLTSRLRPVRTGVEGGEIRWITSDSWSE
jgi:hypothetical protein